ncbi:MAG: hypothetical protein ACTJHC_06920 [Vagococcus sp.]
MYNNQDEMNRLINELALQKNKDRKHVLRIEIAKATDRTVKKALQDILDDIERKERRNRIVGIIAFIVVGLIGFYFLGTKNDNKNNVHVTKVSTSSLSITSDSTANKQPIIKEKNLTDDEVKQWVSAVWDKRYKNIKQTYGYELNVRIDDKDHLVYIGVVPPKGIEIDSFGSFRINANGELEESGYFVEGANINDWVVISTKFMDVSQVTIKEPIGPNTEERIKKVELSAKEFAELYKEYSKKEYPIMSIPEFSEAYGHMEDYDDSIRIITYNDSNDDVASISEDTPRRMSKFFYTYDKYEKKAYWNRNNGSGEKEFLPELTEYINTSMNE